MPPHTKNRTDARRRKTPDVVKRQHLEVEGAVQGVGFRPFVYQLAHELDLKGWIQNHTAGVGIDIEGNVPALAAFRNRLLSDRPPHAEIEQVRVTDLDPTSYTAFDIRDSDDGGPHTALVLPDLATCDACRAEIFDPQDRRYLYPFTNCTHCGPRFSIIRALPYDRANTTMQAFEMCPACRAEYEDPSNRRFHAQPNACPTCGPHLAWWDAHGVEQATRKDAMHAAARAIEDGYVVAVKGLGGFHLMALATSDEAVLRLRQRKHRDAKPLAVMYPHLSCVVEDVQVDKVEERLLTSPEAPIVLLRKRANAKVSEHVAPDNPYLGVMLPYTPLHHILMHLIDAPVVATSGNISDETICTDEEEARHRLHGIADYYLVHNRSIERNVDDSIVRVIMGREMILRRARGYAPLPVNLQHETSPVLAVGAHLKNTVAISRGHAAFISQHIGDLETEQARDAFEKITRDLRTLFDIYPGRVACDLHPDYASTLHAKQMGLPCIEVQHHYAHVLACMEENELEGPVLGVSWDGTGLGPDGTIWGGEFMLADEEGYHRVAHLRRFSLPGGDEAIRQPRRSALGILYELFGEKALEIRSLPCITHFSDFELRVLSTMMKQEFHVSRTSSMGRLFDAVAALLDLKQVCSFEGEAAMAVEFAADGVASAPPYPYVTHPDAENPVQIALNWEPMIYGILDDLRAGVDKGIIAARFHETLVEMILSIARTSAIDAIVLTGGCFQNKLLIERSIVRLREEGYTPYWHQRVPTNDGGVAYGQLVAASYVEDENACV